MSAFRNCARRFPDRVPPQHPAAAIRLASDFRYVLRMRRRAGDHTAAMVQLTLTNGLVGLPACLRSLRAAHKRRREPHKLTGGVAIFACLRACLPAWAGCVHLARGAVSLTSGVSIWRRQSPLEAETAEIRNPSEIRNPAFLPPPSSRPHAHGP